MANRELHIEQLLGVKVFDSEGKHAGRIEEVIAEREGDEWVVREYWVGRSALLTRFSARDVARALLGFLGAKENAGYKVPWDKLDLTRPKRLRLHCPCHELEELTVESEAGRKRRGKRKQKK
jgi:sporulation protein YlmC with PRC-barrel domain